MTVKETPSFGGGTLVFDRPIVLLVEGPDDRAFAARVVESFNDGSRWHIHHMEGNTTDWVSMLRVAQASDYFQDHGEAIGLMLDADASASAAVDKARGFLTKSGLDAPLAHSVVQGSPLRTGFFISPNGASPGALEELLLAGADSPRLSLAETYIETVSAEIDAPKKPKKAVVQALLAGQVEHVKSIPVGVRKRIFDPRHAAYDDFRRFLNALEG